jgi:hypothetical protein
MVRNRIIAIFIVFIVLIVLTFSYFIEERENKNIRPEIEILYPDNEEIVSKIVTISGTASDPDGDDELLEVEIKINGKWILAEGNVKWSYEWRTYDIDDGQYTIQVRCWDGFDYSKVEEIKLTLDNPVVVDSDSHKWAVFIIAANFPLDNESKLGNGALNLAEVMVDYFVNELKYSTSNIFILFDDGWIRDDNGFGKPIQTLDQRRHTYDVTYGGATSSTVESTLNFVIQQANNFQDSEVFIWIASHGCGDNELYAGGKIFERSAVFLWDGKINDEQLADLLYPLKSKRTCILVDACFAGGFADKTILNFPELFLFKSNIAKNGRVIISATSKFRVGYTSITTGPLFTQLWFRGILTGEADGFLPGFLKTGRPSMLRIFKDGKVSVEESFYFARYTLKNSKGLQDFNKMEPQINDRYPRLSILFNNRGLILGE